MKIIEIWRYPVKTMAGEKLNRIGIGPLGIEGGEMAVGDEVQLVQGRACVHDEAIAED